MPTHLEIRPAVRRRPAPVRIAAAILAGLLAVLPLACRQSDPPAEPAARKSAQPPSTQADNPWLARADEFWLRMDYESGQGLPSRLGLHLSGPKAPANRTGAQLTTSQAEGVIRLLGRDDIFRLIFASDLPIPCYLVTYGVGAGDKVPDEMQQRIVYPAERMLPIVAELEKVLDAGPAAEALAEFKDQAELLHHSVLRLDSAIRPEDKRPPAALSWPHEVRYSPAKLAGQPRDGTLLVRIVPRPYWQRVHQGVAIGPDGCLGPAGPEMEPWIAFKLAGRDYFVSLAYTGFPFTDDAKPAPPDTRYRFLIRLWRWKDTDSVSCTLKAVWDDRGRFIWATAPAGAPATQPEAERAAMVDLVRQAIRLPARNRPAAPNDGWGRSPTGLDLSGIVKVTGQGEDVAQFPKERRKCWAAIDRMKADRKLWALATLLDHPDVDVAGRAADVLVELNDRRIVPVLLAAAKQNGYSVKGSEEATIHDGYRCTLKEGLERLLGRSLTPKGLRMFVHETPGQETVIRSEDDPSKFPEYVDFAAVEDWLRRTYPAAGYPAVPATQPEG